MASPDGCLYRLDPDLTVLSAAAAFTVSNGSSWSPDGRTFYFTDTMQSVTLAYDFDAENGTTQNRRTFVEMPAEEGYPAGHTVDREGFLWTAHWRGSRLSRYDRTGKKGREIRLPAALVTCCAFGGPDLDESYITTAWDGLDAAARYEQPMAGDLFRVRTGVQGMLPPKFAGCFPGPSEPLHQLDQRAVRVGGAHDADRVRRRHGIGQELHAPAIQLRDRGCNVVHKERDPAHAGPEFG